MKKWLCSSDSVLGKLVQFVGHALYSTETVEKVDDLVRDGVREVAFFCPCCMFWRGVLLGGSVAALLVCLGWWL